MEVPEYRQEAKMELMAITSELMPKGEPNLLGVIKYPTIDRLCQEVGKKVVRLMILMLIKDLCNSLNVVRNMNEDQMIESACMLLDECDNFRLEDYVMMFSLAKRGSLVKIYDRVDIDLIGEMMNEYWLRRNQAGQKKQLEEFNYFEDQLKQIERAPGKTTLKEIAILEESMSDEAKEAKEKLKKITAQMAGTDPETIKQQDEERAARIKEQQEFYKRSMTPEQIRELEERQRQIQSAASRYEIEQKEK